MLCSRYNLISLPPCINQPIYRFPITAPPSTYSLNTTPSTNPTQSNLSLLNFLLEDPLESDSVGRELRDTLTEFLDRHLLFVELEAEQ